MIIKDLAKSTRKIQKETMQRGAIGFAAFILPVVTTNLTSVYFGIALATIEIAAIFLTEYFIKRAKQKKAIKV